MARRLSGEDFFFFFGEDFFLAYRQLSSHYVFIWWRRKEQESHRALSGISSLEDINPFRSEPLMFMTPFNFN